jgi:asparagine synthase (glutamine-hydrolysing)
VSGIVGIVNLDGTPVDERLLSRMTDSLAYRGPDRQHIWVDASVGFGHTLLRTTIESEHEEQPATLDGGVWITADARVDDRAELARQLESRGRRIPGNATDAQLILHAYHVWGEDCVEHLLGDFAFAIWDGRTGRLFCARDHFGVKPFYYAEVQRHLVLSNSLDCVRLHPGVGDALNEPAIGDFLLFGYNHEPMTTTFAAVQRLPPAHSLTCGQATVRRRRYWTLPTDGRIRYRRSQEYVDHFKDVLRVAVSDRLRTSHVGVWMSGGLDSTTIASTARQIRSERGASVDLRAHTFVYDSLIPDEEQRYARIAAEALGVEHDVFVADRYRPFDGWVQRDVRTPEPTDDPFLHMRLEQLQRAATHSRVLLCGEGGDEVLWGSYVVDLLGRMRPLELIADLARSLAFHRRRPAGGVRSRLEKWLRRRDSALPPYPAWLNGAFTDRFDLRDRWAQWNTLAPLAVHPLRPEAHGRLAIAPWSWYFESFDPGVTRIPVEGRYPFLDLRLVNYLLAIPPLPWCIDKLLLRLATRGALPDPIRLRRKTPLAGDPLRAQIQKTGAQWLDGFDLSRRLSQYVDRVAFRHAAEGWDSDDLWLYVRPLCLDYWLTAGVR